MFAGFGKNCFSLEHGIPTEEVIEILQSPMNDHSKPLLIMFQVQKEKNSSS